MVVAWDNSRNTIGRVCGREQLRPRDAAGEQWQSSKGLEIRMLNREHGDMFLSKSFQSIFLPLKTPEILSLDEHTRQRHSLLLLDHKKLTTE